MAGLGLGFFRKLKWFFLHYDQISFGKQLISPNSIAIESGVFLGPVTYQTDSLVTSNNCDFIGEPRFAAAYAAAAATNPWPGFTLQWRVLIVCWFAEQVKDLAGDFVECGVNTGAYARAVVEYINFSALNKTFHLFDTFSGLVSEQITTEERTAGIDKYLGNYHDVYGEVKKTFASFRVNVVKGMVPESLTAFTGEKVCYLSIDMNVTEPEIAAAHFFWDKLVPGAVIILDDYGFPQHKSQKQAFDSFAREKSVTILSLPTGQGIIIKPGR